jgi:pimeloyl-ACP methyl ester carboxylesterase
MRQDPVSGGHAAGEIRRLFEASGRLALVERPDVGHWPMLEDPAAVDAAMTTFFTAAE